MLRIAIATLMLTGPLTAHALNVFACEPEWGSLVEEIAGAGVSITQATTAFQDPHRLQARPSLIAAARRADLVVCAGADLEIGWLPLLLRRAGNSRIQPGSPGYFEAAGFVRRLEIPKTIDRSQGDVHPQGNPHVHLDPRNIERVAVALVDRMSEVDPANAATYAANGEDFLTRWRAATAQWEAGAQRLAGMRLVSHHRSFSYLAAWLNLDIVATLEPKPGIPASGAQLAKLLNQLIPDPPQGVIRAPFENEKPALWLSERLEVPEINLPYTVGGSDDVTDLFTLFETTVRMLEEHRQ